MDVATTRRLACDAGCTVDGSAERAGSPARVEVTCANGWQAARYLALLARADVTDAGARRVRAALGTVDDRTFVERAHAWVRDHVRFEREQGEVFQAPAVTVGRGAGDCDCHARLLFAVLAPRVPVRLAFLYRGKSGPRHVVVQAKMGGRWTWLETTVQRAQNAAGVDARPGEHPVLAAMRARMMRPDIARGMRAFIIGGPMDLEKGATYRLRLGVTGTDDAEAAVRRALAAAGFADAPVSLWFDASERPEDFPSALADALPNVSTVWGEATYAGATRDIALPAPLDGEAPVTLDGVALWEDAPPATKPSIPAPPGIGSIGAVATKLTAHLSDGFFAAVATMARDFRARGANVTGEDFLAVFLSESGVRASSKNSLGYAGLNGMGARERAAVGFSGSLDDWTSLTAEEQVPYVRRFFEADVASFCGGSFACLANAGSLYLMNFLPAYMKHATEPGFALATRAADDDGSLAYTRAHPSDWYANNRGLDHGNKGTIVVDDMRLAIQVAVSRSPDYWRELTARMAAAGESGGLTGGGVGLAGAVALVLFLAGVGLVGYTYVAPHDAVGRAVLRLGDRILKVIG